MSAFDQLALAGHVKEVTRLRCVVSRTTVDLDLADAKIRDLMSLKEANEGWRREVNTLRAELESNHLYKKAQDAELRANLAEQRCWSSDQSRALGGAQVRDLLAANKSLSDQMANESRRYSRAEERANDLYVELAKVKRAMIARDITIAAIGGRSGTLGGFLHNLAELPPVAELW